MFKFIFQMVFLMIASATAFCQEANYDESKIPPYKLPDPLVFESGKKVENSGQWELRRAEILKLFENEMFGISPAWNGAIKAKILASEKDALDGAAIMKEIRLTLVNGPSEHSFNMLVYLPKSEKKVPLVLGYNFNGNHTVINDPAIALANVWKTGGGQAPVMEKGKESERGSEYSRWQVKEIVSRGYGLATIYYGDVDPDYDDGFQNGVHALYSGKPDSSSWGSIAAWAWGLSRAMDYIVKMPEVDASKVIVMGHSRLGKAALWAGATDQRFAMVISNNSGCGGAALSKRVYGETVGRINRTFPHWFCDNFNKYNEKEELLPFDQHELLALIAPRPVYVASAIDDQWADPKGEFLSCVAASPVYVLLGKKGFEAEQMPSVNSPVYGSISYHIRTGVHDVTLYDWQRYLDNADRYFGNK
jgi:hypothetical protein